MPTAEVMDRKEDAPAATSPFIIKHVKFPSDTAESQKLQDYIQASLEQHGFPADEVSRVRVALEEAFNNAIKHGNQLDKSKCVEVLFAVRANLFEAHILDQGAGFNPDDVPDPTAPENLERPCGRGVFLMRQFMSEVMFHPPLNNRVTLRKRVTKTKNIGADV